MMRNLCKILPLLAIGLILSLSSVVMAQKTKKNNSSSNAIVWKEHSIPTKKGVASFKLPGELFETGKFYGTDFNGLEFRIKSDQVNMLSLSDYEAGLGLFDKIRPDYGKIIVAEQSKDPNFNAVSVKELPSSIFEIKSKYYANGKRHFVTNRFILRDWNLFFLGCSGVETFGGATCEKYLNSFSFKYKPK